MYATNRLGICASSAIKAGGKRISCITLTNTAAVESVRLPRTI
jgi:hypothetical protein